MNHFIFFLVCGFCIQQTGTALYTQSNATPVKFFGLCKLFRTTFSGVLHKRVLNKIVIRRPFLMEIDPIDEPIDLMEDGEIPWDFIIINETIQLPRPEKKKWKLPPFTYFDDPLQVGFLFV